MPGVGFHADPRARTELIENAREHLDRLLGIANRLERADGRVRHRQISVHDPCDNCRAASLTHKRGVKGKTANRLIARQPEQVLGVKDQYTIRPRSLMVC